ncbi:MAG: tRNA (adenosine(37)-N6)-threonylcarbamoyltransferase complex dimerization subunit type 1 TsaB, partial [Acidimicrobiales bacterium]
MESATELAGVALADHAGVLATVTASRRRRHCETIAPSVQFACRQAEVSLSDIDAVAVDVGPGLFTGLRVG